MYGTGPTAVYTGPYNLRYAAGTYAVLLLGYLSIQPKVQPQVLLRVLARSSLASDAACGTRGTGKCVAAVAQIVRPASHVLQGKCCSLTTWPITKSEQCGLSASSITQRSRHADFFPTQATSYQYFITRVGHKTQQSTQSMHQPSFDVAHGNTAYL